MTTEDLNKLKQGECLLQRISMKEMEIKNLLEIFNHERISINVDKFEYLPHYNIKNPLRNQIKNYLIKRMKNELSELKNKFETL